MGGEEGGSGEVLSAFVGVCFCGCRFFSFPFFEYKEWRLLDRLDFRRRLYPARRWRSVHLCVPFSP